MSGTVRSQSTVYAPLRCQTSSASSHHYTDFCFAYGARRDPPPAIVSTIKLRQAGFADCIETEDMFRHWFRTLAGKRILPAIRR